MKRESDLDGDGPRWRLRIPVEIDEVLAELSRWSGRSKASYAVEALGWYLPRLRGLLFELRAAPALIPSRPKSEACLDGHGKNMLSDGSAERSYPPGHAKQPLTGLSRQQRRALKRQERKAGGEARKAGGWR